MSAFIISAKQMAIICNFAVYDQTNKNIFLRWLDEIQKAARLNQNIVSFEKDFIEEIKDFEDEFSYLDNYKLLAKILTHANFVSVQYRYGREDDELRKEIYLDEVYKLADRDDLGAKSINAFQFIKFCHCLSYQSCEHPEYYDSLAHMFIKIAEPKAIINAPEYSLCEWAA